MGKATGKMQTAHSDSADYIIGLKTTRWCG